MKTKHGDAGHGKIHKLYATFSRMKGKCYNPTHDHYKWYGARGIKICDEWLNSYVAFRDWALSNGYIEGLTLNRKENNGNYTPDNCNWVTMKEQSRNRRSNKFVVFNGVRMTNAEVAEKYGMSQITLGRRLLNGWGSDRAIKQPVGKSVYVTCNGITKNLSGWAEYLKKGISTIALQKNKGRIDAYLLKNMPKGESL